MKKKMNYILLLLMTVFMIGCTEAEDTASTEGEEQPKTEEVATDDATNEEADTEKEIEEKNTSDNESNNSTEESTNTTDDQFSGYERINIDGGDQSGHREAKVVVDIGFGDREYWAFTNEHGQLVRVVAEEITLQDDETEDVVSSGRYYWDEAQVPGVESDQLDQGHVIADSLGGVSNAYNITPQESTLNRHGDQAYMEDAIRKAGGATDFEAVITYPDTVTQIPSSYQYTYTIQGNEVVDTFDNVNPDEVNESLGLTNDEPSGSSDSNDSSGATEKGDVSSVDTNGNGQVTIQEAKDAGFSMPITSDHWLYEHMQDRDGDGMVGE
ncbi:DNA/RNA non-specific endonuclease [Salimicrobium halophilum]|uniref:DNA/RNA non-specific endonuclease n=1 Tax=Salimicrobium halophilum TaxID=86666 RepID=A0A1G8W526_9BACI|nr:DNA/RNA non-specific endonuclease [Salimicrobium halophilum]SDJ73392.1 DNA/RNA non-specific endonuclease [Salimicrobium halophilum]